MAGKYKSGGSHLKQMKNKAKMKRQYTYSNTKAVVFFIVSVIVSMALDPIFDRMASRLFKKNQGIEKSVYE